MSSGDEAEPTDADVVVAAAEAAEGMVFSRIDRADLDDLDVTVNFENRRLEVDVYLHAPAATVDGQRVAEDATLAAREAVDELLE